MSEQPSLLQAMIAARTLGYKHRGLIAVTPVRIIFLIIAPPLLIRYFPNTDLPNTNDEDARTILSAMIVVYGFFGAATVAAITQIIEMATRFPFSDFLKKQEVFDIYTSIPQYVFIVEMISLSACSIFIIFVSILPNYVNNYLIILSAGCTLYCCWITVDLLSVIRGLAFHYEEYQRILHDLRSEDVDHTAN